MPTNQTNLTESLAQSDAPESAPAESRGECVWNPPRKRRRDERGRSCGSRAGPQSDTGAAVHRILCTSAESLQIGHLAKGFGNVRRGSSYEGRPAPVVEQGLVHNSGDMWVSSLPALLTSTIRSRFKKRLYTPILQRPIIRRYVNSSKTGHGGYQRTPPASSVRLGPSAEYTAPSASRATRRMPRTPPDRGCLSKSGRPSGNWRTSIRSTAFWSLSPANAGARRASACLRRRRGRSPLTY